ncbi:MAG: hypothetical protein U5Q16_01355 [Gammaproteobacteria bacterium]|nr:hypothetical protein [Gammaproteobacteria bacterium]
MTEDDPALDIDVTTAFDDVDIDTNGDTLDYSVSHSGDPVFISVVEDGNGTVTLTLDPDQNGSATVTGW